MVKVTFNSQDKLNDNYQFQGQNDFFVNIILYLRLITFLESDNLTNLIFKKNCMEK